MTHASSALPAVHEWARLYTMPGMSERAIHAHLESHQFVRHAHEHYVVALVERGALGFLYRGVEHVATAGQIALVNAGESHTGQAVKGEGCTYWSVAIEHASIARAAAALGIPNHEAFRFDEAVVDDRMLWWRFARARNAMCAGAGLDEVRSLMSSALGWLVQRHMRGVTPPAPREWIERARVHLETHYRERVSLRSLGDMFGCSPFYLARVFHADVGIPPHTYLEMCRIRAACALLASGERLSDVAYLVGFPDQAHFTRRFKRTIGLTPGAFVRDLGAASARDATPLRSRASHR
ncbi:MAG: AraC family transcriptional regulator [bacterium]